MLRRIIATLSQYLPKTCDTKNIQKISPSPDVYIGKKANTLSICAKLVQELLIGIKTKPYKKPVIIAITGSVAVGKSYLGRIIHDLFLQANQRVALINTDNFILSNKELEKRGISERKGFPESYNLDALKKCLSAFKKGQHAYTIPTYSHEKYDIDLTKEQTIKHCEDIIILEGLQAFNFADIKIYVHAEEAYIQKWFLERCLCFRQESKPGYFYWQFKDVPDEIFIKKVEHVWETINKENLHKHIFPLRYQADIVLCKDQNHNMRYSTSNT